MKKSVNILYSFSGVLHCLGEKISTMFSELDSIFFFIIIRKRFTFQSSHCTHL